MSTLVRLIWPKDTKGQLKEFRSNISVLFFIYLPIWWCLLIRGFHMDASVSVLLILLMVVTFSSFLACWWMIAKPINPFREQLFLPRHLSELDDSALRVLSFLKSPKAKFLNILTNLTVSTIFLIVLIIDLLVFQSADIIKWGFIREWWHPNGIIVILCISGAYMLSIVSTQLVVIHTWIAKHFEQILSTYEPWPKDRPF